MRLACMAIVTIGLFASGAAYAGTPGWFLSETSGQVSVVSTGLVKAAVRGGSVASGDIVNTGRNGRAVLVRGEEYLVVAPNSRIRVADPAKAGGLTQIIESFGNVIYKIKKMTMPHFAVETPFLAAVVKGTTFSVTVTDKGASVQVIEGRVEVATRDGGASFLVLPGDIGSVSASAPASLDVRGRETKTITSPTPAAAAAAVSASVAEQVAERGAEPDSAELGGILETPVGEGVVNLGAISDGMVTGDPAMTALAAITKTAGVDVQTPAAAPPGPDGPAASAPVATITQPVAVAEAAPMPLPPVQKESPTPVMKPLEPAVKPIEVVTAPPAPTLPPAPAPLEVPQVIVAATLPPTAAPPPLQVIVTTLPAVLNGIGEGIEIGQGNGSGKGKGNGSSNPFGHDDMKKGKK